LKTLSCLLLAALLTGCLPIGIRGSNLPNLAGAPLGAAAQLVATYYLV
jgi:hypothetical protein